MDITGASGAPNPGSKIGEETPHRTELPASPLFAEDHVYSSKTKILNTCLKLESCLESIQEEYRWMMKTQCISEKKKP